MKHNQHITSINRKNAGFWLLCAAVIFGMIAGSIWTAGGGSPQSPWLHQFFSPEQSGNTLPQVFGNTLASSAVFLAAAFLAGLSAVGQPVGAALLIFRGFAIGASAAAMYIAEGLGAVPAVLVLLVPKAVAVVFISILAARETIRSSVKLFRCLFSMNDSATDVKGFKLYCIKFVVLLIISIIISAADSLMNYLFAGLLR